MGVKNDGEQTSQKPRFDVCRSFLTSIRYPHILPVLEVLVVNCDQPCERCNQNREVNEPCWMQYRRLPPTLIADWRSRFPAITFRTDE